MNAHATLSWKEIQSRAIAFSKSWEGAFSERSDAQTFWNEFFEIFGISRRRVASFETKATRFSGRAGSIDLFWPSKLLVEHKSLGEDLKAAFEQATDYFAGLTEKELPRYVLVSDFRNLHLYDLDLKKDYQISLKDLCKHIHLFGFIAGYDNPQETIQEDPINQEAAEALGQLHEKLKKVGYTGHKLEVLLVRLLFCLFAQNTGIFEHGSFQKLIRNTRDDGADLGARIAHLFETLNTEEGNRYKNLDDELSRFPYVNGHLFEERLSMATFDSDMRNAVIDCCKLDWATISPAIFGTLFQSIMDEDSRRTLGAHYTSEQNILKLIKPLFLDDLWDEFHRIKKVQRKLNEFHTKLSLLNFLDPACGCGNFLVIAYRELRKLELEVVRSMLESGEQYLNISILIRVDVNQFYGIEIEEFPAQIAQVALWLTDHQMNQLVSKEFGQYFARIPLKASARIVNKNALRLNWNEIVLPDKLSYILGNPPFVGPKNMDEEQKKDAALIFKKIHKSGLLDYVAAWFVKVLDYIHSLDKDPNHKIHCAFVSTNSIVQGEQVGVLWKYLLANGVHIHFAHRSFRWRNEAKGLSAVHCVIIGFGIDIPSHPVIYDYLTPNGDPQTIKATRINPYLVDGPDVLIERRSSPICNVPKMKFGNQPIDGGHLILSEEERNSILIKEPEVQPFIRKYIGAEEFLHGTTRYCLWLKDAPPDILRRSSAIHERLDLVRKFRLKRKSSGTQAQKLASKPSQFAHISHPETEYLLVPSVSSERREYIPLGFMPSDVIASNLCLIVPNAMIYHFGILSSAMHMAWVRMVAGRLESRYRYSAEIVYNNFPWPDEKTRNSSDIITLGEHILKARKKHSRSTLVDLYDPLTMPSDLLEAHLKLDRAVEFAYGIRGSKTEAERIAFLFDRYKELTN
jgi:hypothetical protein